MPDFDGCFRPTDVNDKKKHVSNIFQKITSHINVTKTVYKFSYKILQPKICIQQFPNSV